MEIFRFREYLWISSEIISGGNLVDFLASGIPLVDFTSRFIILMWLMGRILRSQKEILTWLVRQKAELDYLDKPYCT